MHMIIVTLWFESVSFAPLFPLIMVSIAERNWTMLKTNLKSTEKRVNFHEIERRRDCKPFTKCICCKKNLLLGLSLPRSLCMSLCKRHKINIPLMLLNLDIGCFEAWPYKHCALQWQSLYAGNREWNMDARCLSRVHENVFVCFWLWFSQFGFFQICVYLSSILFKEGACFHQKKKTNNCVDEMYSSLFFPLRLGISCE